MNLVKNPVPLPQNNAASAANLYILMYIQFIAKETQRSLQFLCVIRSFYNNSTSLTSMYKKTHLHEFAKVHANRENFRDGAQQCRNGQHAVFQASVQKVAVARQNFIHICHLKTKTVFLKNFSFTKKCYVD